MRTSLLALVPLAMLATLLLGFLLRTMDTSVLIFIPVMLAMFTVLVLVLRLVYKQQLDNEEHWKQFATSNGLDLDLAAPGSNASDIIDRQVKGTYEGLPVSFQAITQGTSNNSRTYLLRGEVKLRTPLPDGVRLERRGIFKRKGIPTGDARFDAAILLQGLNAQRQADLLTPELRGALVALAKNVNEIKLEGDRLRWKRRGIVNDPKKLDIMLRQTVLVGHALDRGLQGLHSTSASMPGGARLPDFSTLPAPPQEEPQATPAQAKATAKVKS